MRYKRRENRITRGFDSLTFPLLDNIIGFSGEMHGGAVGSTVAIKQGEHLCVEIIKIVTGA